MIATESPALKNSLPELFVWIDNFKDRSERFDDSTPEQIWDFALRALALRCALSMETASPGFREAAEKNFRRFVAVLMDWEWTQSENGGSRRCYSAAVPVTQNEFQQSH